MVTALFGHLGAFDEFMYQDELYIKLKKPYIIVQKSCCDKDKHVKTNALRADGTLVFIRKDAEVVPIT